MKKYSKKRIVFSIIIVICLAALLLVVMDDLLTIESLKKNSLRLQEFVQSHYLLAVIGFGMAFFSTAFIVPGALVLTLGAGFVFGAVAGAFYSIIFLTASSTAAFLASRYFIGHWVQTHYQEQLKRFNREIELHGMNYLFVLRIMPVMPAFLLNYLSGLTRISTTRFTVVSFLGISPGAAVYALAGRQLATIRTTSDILSPDVAVVFLLLALLALLPVLYAKSRHLFRRSG